MPFLSLLFAGTLAVSWLSGAPTTAAAAPTWSGMSAIYYDPSEDDPAEQYLKEAAEELKLHLEKVSGTYTITTSAPPSTGIFLAVNAADAAFTGKNDEAFRLFTDAAGIHITGKTPIAARHGAYALLEELGFRWYFKHPSWWVTPSSLSTLSLNKTVAPFFVKRGIRASNGEMIGSRDGIANSELWWTRNAVYTDAEYETKHNWTFADRDSVAVEDPTAVCYKPDGITPQQSLPDHPVVINRALNYARNYFDGDTTGKQMSVPISPPDGNYIWCDEWQEDLDGDGDLDYSAQVITDKVFALTNEVAKMLQVEYPGKYASVLSYSWYSAIPSFDLEDNVYVHATTFVRGTDLSLEQRVDGYKQMGAFTGVTEYYDVWPWWRDRIPPAGKFKTLIQSMQTAGLSNADAFYFAASDNFGPKGRLYWAGAKMMWDPMLDFDVLLDDFYTHAFGPAGGSMKRYYKRFDSQWKAEYVNNPKNSVMGLAFRDLDEAMMLSAGDPEVQERVRQVFYHTYFWWRWGDNVLKRFIDFADAIEAEEMYTFLYKIRDLQLITFRLQERDVRSVLEITYGLTPEEIKGLQELQISGTDACAYDDVQCRTQYVTTPYSDDEARVLLDTALANWTPEELAGAEYIDYSTLELQALGDDSTPKLLNNYYGTDYDRYKGWQISTILVPSGGDEEFDIELYGLAISAGPVSVDWVSPDGTVLATQEASWDACAGGYDDQVPCLFHVTTTSPGIYSLRTPSWHEHWAVSIDRPVAHLLNGSGYAGPDGKGYFYVPAGTAAFVVAEDYGGDLTITAPDGTSTVVNNEERPFPSPQAGLWQYSTDLATMKLLGIPPLGWHDPRNLLVSASAIPVAADDSYSVDEDGMLFVDAALGVLANDSHPSGDPVTVSEEAGPSNGALTLNSDGSFSYTPAKDFSDIDSFIYTASLGVASSAPATVRITVKAINDPPSFTGGPDQVASTAAGAYVVPGWAVAISPGPADEFAQTVSFIVANNNNALFAVQPTVSPDGALTYQPSASANGVATVFVQLQDDGGTANAGADTSPVQTFTVIVGAAIGGTVSLQGVADGSPASAAIGLTVTLTPNGAGPSTVVAVASDRTFSFTDVAAGSYTITASADGFRSRQRAGAIVSTLGIALPHVTLDAGMVNADTTIDGADLSLVAGNFGSTTFDRTDGLGNCIDLNADGAVSAMDISSVTVNIGLTGIQPW